MSNFVDWKCENNCKLFCLALNYLLSSNEQRKNAIVFFPHFQQLEMGALADRGHNCDISDNREREGSRRKTSIAPNDIVIMSNQNQ